MSWWVLSQAQRELEQRHGVRVASWAGELARPETLEAAFEVVRREFGGRLSAFVHNAGALQGCYGTGPLCGMRHCVGRQENVVHQLPQCAGGRVAMRAGM